MRPIQKKAKSRGGAKPKQHQRAEVGFQGRANLRKPEKSETSRRGKSKSRMKLPVRQY